MEEPVYLNCSSAMKFQKTLPEFVVFREIVETTKPFMQCMLSCCGLKVADRDFLHCVYLKYVSVCWFTHWTKYTNDKTTGIVFCFRLTFHYLLNVVYVMCLYGQSKCGIAVDFLRASSRSCTHLNYLAFI